ncbi:MAG: SUMF1/EgtB/PvdO family nonheme iron enzyme [Nitrospirae bacterium]|nr:SUMF1/EgtB/PvdO family nonheme iron enzyme [Nitrospirota bacterium]
MNRHEPGLTKADENQVKQAGALFLLVQVFLAGMVVTASSAGQTVTEEQMAHVPAGEFIMGSTEKDGLVGQSVGVDEIPQRSVYLKAFYIDRYEVTNRQYKAFIDATGHSAPDDKHPGASSWKGNTPPEGTEDIPVSNITWYDADAYCRWAGKRLPAEEEWEKAARGTDGRQWPWGSDLRGHTCNTRYAGPGQILPPGSVSDDVSPYGVYDMCGNVSEWTSSWYLPYPGSTLKRDSFGETYKVTRGGSLVMPAMPYSRAAYRANTFKPDYRHRGIGFRCAEDDRAH